VDGGDGTEVGGELRPRPAPSSKPLGIPTASVMARSSTAWSATAVTSWRRTNPRVCSPPAASRRQREVAQGGQRIPRMPARSSAVRSTRASSAMSRVRWATDTSALVGRADVVGLQLRGQRGGVERGPRRADEEEVEPGRRRPGSSSTMRRSVLRSGPFGPSGASSIGSVCPARRWGSSVTAQMATASSGGEVGHPPGDELGLLPGAPEATIAGRASRNQGPPEAQQHRPHARHHGPARRRGDSQACTHAVLVPAPWRAAETRCQRLARTLPAACHPHMPWTPGPGGVDCEHNHTPSIAVRYGSRARRGRAIVCQGVIAPPAMSPPT
jgi:hypothetical protein